jgi:hypothetical protein
MIKEVIRVHVQIDLHLVSELLIHSNWKLFPFLNSKMEKLVSRYISPRILLDLLAQQTPIFLQELVMKQNLLRGHARSGISKPTNSKRKESNWN